MWPRGRRHSLVPRSRLDLAVARARPTAPSERTSRRDLSDEVLDEEPPRFDERRCPWASTVLRIGAYPTIHLNAGISEPG